MVGVKAKLYVIKSWLFEVVSDFYMPGEANGISRRQYSRSPAFLYPIFVLLPNFELCKGSIK